MLILYFFLVSGGIICLHNCLHADLLIKWGIYTINTLFYYLFTIYIPLIIEGMEGVEAVEADSNIK